MDEKNVDLESSEAFHSNREARLFRSYQKGLFVQMNTLAIDFSDLPPQTKRWRFRVSLQPHCHSLLVWPHHRSLPAIFCEAPIYDFEKLT
jgi:hypothetical protein